MHHRTHLRTSVLTILGICAMVFGITACTEATDSGETNGKPTGKYSLTAEVTGENGQMTRFIGMIGTVNYIVDSAMTDGNGKVTFSADSLLPAGLYYFVFPDNNYIQFLLDKDQEMSFKASKDDITNTMVVEGSLDNELFYQNLRFEAKFQAEVQPIDAQAQSLPPGPQKEEAIRQRDAKIAERKAHIKSFQDSHPNSFFTQFKTAGQNPDLKTPQLPGGGLDSALQVYYYRMEFWDNVDFKDERMLRTPIIANKLENYIGKVTDQRIDSVIKYADIVTEKAKASPEMFKFFANTIAIKYRQSPIMGGEAIFVHMVDKYFSDKQAFWSTPEELAKIRKEVNDMRVSLLGNTAKDLVCTNLAGKEESLLSLQAPFLVLYMYSYECEHCQEYTPILVDVYKQWKNKGVEVYALCTNQGEKEWKDFVQKNKMQDFHNVYDPQYKSDYYQKYHVDITPELYVINKDRKIVAKDLHPDQLSSTLAIEMAK